MTFANDDQKPYELILFLTMMSIKQHSLKIVNQTLPKQTSSSRPKDIKGSALQAAVSMSRYRLFNPFMYATDPGRPVMC